VSGDGLIEDYPRGSILLLWRQVVMELALR
jgi:hypothetical protein